MSSKQPSADAGKSSNQLKLFLRESVVGPAGKKTPNPKSHHFNLHNHTRANCQRTFRYGFSLTLKSSSENTVIISIQQNVCGIVCAFDVRFNSLSTPAD